jgi:hypothetical protein
MKKLLLLLIVFTGMISSGTAQSPARFNYDVKKIDGLHYRLTITVNINSPWHIYAQDAPPPVLPTTISFAKNPMVEFKSKPVEKGNLVTKHDEVFDADLKYYDNKVEYIQEVTLKTAVKTTLNGSIEYMLCTDEQCIKPNPEQFKLTLE